MTETRLPAETSAGAEALARADVPAREETLVVGPLEVLPAEHLARARGRALVLSDRELRLLAELARNADRIVAREQLFERAWGQPMRPHDRSVDVYVRKLRVKLAVALPDWRFIHTHFGFGYRLAAERNTIATSDSQPVYKNAPRGRDTRGSDR